MNPSLAYIVAMFICDIWDPEKAPKGRKLYYRTRGIVQFDRIINNELDRC